MRVEAHCVGQVHVFKLFHLFLEQSKNYKVSYEHIDLGNLDSVRVFAQKFIYNHSRLDILINNAGSYVILYT